MKEGIYNIYLCLFANTREEREKIFPRGPTIQDAGRKYANRYAPRIPPLEYIAAGPSLAQSAKAKNPGGKKLWPITIEARGVMYSM